MTKFEALKKYFGYDTFRPLQEEAIDTLLGEKDTLVLMPTGGGKSLCYQVPALIMQGTCIVISPLIALMKDQVEALKLNGIEAEFINSSMSVEQQRAIEQKCIEGKLKLLYISPEKIANNYLEFLKRIKISFFAIDEAHCVSFWGHDFRPEYAQLGNLKAEFPNAAFMALTATADKVTRKDILSQLKIPDAQVFISSFDRPNLSLKVLSANNRVEYIANFIKERKDKSGIIYCLSRKSTEELAEKLQKLGIKAKFYHAGMPSQERGEVQDLFLKDDIQVMCATIAFGMGINKSNIRWIIHYNLPNNVESFYQEIGRAGRDGLPAETILFYSYGDVITRLDMMKDLSPERKELQQAKLDRIKQYALADICRRRILLSYFNEQTDTDCGNCDVCLNPRTRFDATLLAQKVLSAIARTDEKIAMTMLVDILRGSMNKNLVDKNYHSIKTFGAGKELKIEEWNDYILQMLNSGVMDIAYDEGHAFKLNSKSWQVLKENKKVELVRFVSSKQAKSTVEKEIFTLKKSKRETIKDELLIELKKLRKQMADEQNVPAYVIFNDKTLESMAEEKPIDSVDMLQISGVGHHKFNLYGEYFLQAIRDYISKQTTNGVKIEGATYVQTLDLYKKGFSVSEISQQRNLHSATIISHLIKCSADGHAIDFSEFISSHEIETITKAALQINYKNGTPMKPLFEYLKGEYEYTKIKLALQIVEKQNMTEINSHS
jgi:ATP-dependent DNA helicase RecQ